MREWERQHARLVELGDQEAEAKDELDNHDNIKSTVIALAMREAEQAGHKTAAAQRREADASASYGQWGTHSQHPPHRATSMAGGSSRSMRTNALNRQCWAAAHLPHAWQRS